MTSVPVLTYHSVAPWAPIGPDRLGSHLAAARAAGIPCLGPADLAAGRAGFLVTFDDGFADLWTHGLAVLEAHRVHAVVFAIPSRCGEGEPRPRGEPAVPGPASRAMEAASRRAGSHPGFLRWSELRALEDTGLITVQSHSLSHAAGWVSDEITGFNLGRAHWSLAQCTGGDDRLGIPVYRRGSALAHRLYRDDPGLRDHLARWLEARGGAGYVAERGAEAVGRELRDELERCRSQHGDRGGWETEGERERRTVEDLVRAREALESRLGGRRDHLAVPWGQYDVVTLECAKRAGVRRVYTLDRQPNPVGRVGFLVHRFEPRPKGTWWLRSRLWIYRSAWRTALYGILSGRRCFGAG